MLKLLHWLKTREANCARNQSEFQAMTRNLFKAQEKSRAQGAIGFGFCFSLIEKQAGVFLKAISKSGNHNRVISFDSHLKTLRTHLTQPFPFHILTLANHSLSGTGVLEDRAGRIHWHNHSRSGHEEQARIRTCCAEKERWRRNNCPRSRHGATPAETCAACGGAECSTWNNQEGMT